MIDDSGRVARQSPVTSCRDFKASIPVSVSLWLTRRECRSVLKGVVWVTRHMLMSAVLIALDFLVFWILDQVHRQVQGGVVARGDASDMFPE